LTNERYSNPAKCVNDNASEITKNIYESFNNKRSISTSPISFRIKPNQPQMTLMKDINIVENKCKITVGSSNIKNNFMNEST
jgi:hypothetical protein